jgi:hypothetical protein
LVTIDGFVDLALGPLGIVSNASAKRAPKGGKEAPTKGSGYHYGGDENRGISEQKRGSFGYLIPLLGYVWDPIRV